MANRAWRRGLSTMISKVHKHAERGNAALGWILVLGVVAMAFMASMILRNNKQIGLTQKDTFEKAVMVTSHSLAANFKEILVANYNAYQTNSTTYGWQNCTHATPPSVADFLSVMSNPVGGCANVTFTLSAPTTVPPALQAAVSFQTTDPTPQTSVTLANLGKTTLVPVKALNNTNATFTVTGFNTDPSRNAVIGNLAMDSGFGRTLASRKNIQMIVDISRTVNSPQGAPGCHLCLAIPGSVCCPTTLNLSYLQRGTGKVIDAQWNIPLKQLTTTVNAGYTPQPGAMTVKNIASGGTTYVMGSLCVPTGGACSAPTFTVRDAASANGTNYYLTAAGNVLTDTTASPVYSDPKIMSIAFDSGGGSWYLLRSDGAILVGSDITNPTGFTTVAGLIIPNAQRIATGSAPAPVTP